MEREIKMQQSTADRDAAANLARARKVRESEAAFRKEEAELQARIAYRLKELEKSRAELHAFIQRLPGTGSFYVSLRLTGSSSPLVRLLELRRE